MNIAQTYLADCANGAGTRLSVFVSGCTNHCPGCFNPETWDFSYGVPYTEEIEEFILMQLKKPYYRGVSFLGGEPMEFENQRGLAGLIRKIREQMPEKDIWIYTGFLYADLLPGGKQYCEVTDEILDGIDILVDGPFMQEKKNLRLRFRGSENQRIIDMKRTREAGKVVLSQDSQDFKF